MLIVIVLLSFRSRLTLPVEDLKASPLLFTDLGLVLFLARLHSHDKVLVIEFALLGSRLRKFSHQSMSGGFLHGHLLVDSLEFREDTIGFDSVHFLAMLSHMLNLLIKSSSRVSSNARLIIRIEHVYPTMHTSLMSGGHSLTTLRAH